MFPDPLFPLPPAAPPGEKPPPTVFEDQSNEVLLTIFEHDLDGYLRHPESGSVVKSFAACNARLAHALAHPMATEAAIEALWMAADAGQFKKAVDALQDVPLQYLGPCWQAAWLAFAGLARRLPVKTLETLFVHLLDRLPAATQLRLPQLRRAAACLLANQRPGRTQWPANQLLCRCIEGPGIPDGLWRQVLRSLGRHLLPRRILRPDAAALAALTPDRQQALEILQRCRAAYLHPSTLHDALGLLERIEGIADPAIRLDMIHLMRECVSVPIPAQGVQLRARQRQAAMDLADTPLRQEVLQRIWVNDTQEHRSELIERMAPLPPLAAVRVLGRHCLVFENDGQSVPMLDACIGDLNARSGMHHAADHPMFLRLLADRVRRIRDKPSQERNCNLILAECGRVGLHHRLAILGELERGSSSVNHVGHAWAACWKSALQGTLAALRNARTRPDAWPLVQALLPALGKYESREAALDTLLAALPILCPDDQACVLCQIIERLKREPFFWISEAHRCRLIGICSRLPFHLRSGALQGLAQGHEASERPSDKGLSELCKQTEEARQAWKNSIAAGGAGPAPQVFSTSSGAPSAT